MKKPNKRSSFTLVELLVVIAILAILATVSILGYTSFTKKAYISNDETLLAQFNNAIKMEYASEGEKILTETQLKNFVEKYSNQKFSEFSGQSAKYDYHIFFNIDKQEFVLSLLDEQPLETSDTEPTAHINNYVVFADETQERKEVKCDLKDNVFRNAIKQGYYFVDRNNSELSKVLTTIEYPTSGQEYQDAINQLMELVDDAKKDEKEPLENLQKALRSTVIMNEYGIFRYLEVTPDDNGEVHLLICDNENPITLSNDLHINYEVKEENKSISNNVLGDLETSQDLPTLTKEFAEMGIIDIPKNVIASDTDTFVVDENASIVLRFHVDNQEDLKQILGESFQGTNANIVINDVDNLGENQPILSKKNNTFIESGAKVKDIACLVEAIFKYKTEHGDITIVKKMVKGQTPIAPEIPNEVENPHEHIKYIFECWNVNGEPIEEITPIEQNTTYEAKYNDEFLKYKVIYYYENEDGSEVYIEELNNDPIYNEYTYNKELDLPKEWSLNDKVLVRWILHGRTDTPVTRIPAETEGKDGILLIKGEFDNAIKFKINDSVKDAFLYRVGNENSLTLNLLFDSSSTNLVDTNKLKIEIVNINGNSTGTYTKDASDWTMGTIKFTGSGVVKVSLTYDNENPVEIYLEVVNGKNVTQYSELKTTGYNVLLNNIKIPEDGQIAFTNGGIYGNGYTFDVRKGKHSDTKDGNEAGNYVIQLNNSILDNVEIVGEVYTTYGITTKAEYNFPCVLVNSGNCVIANSYISNCASPVRARGGAHLVLKNTILKGGSFCNLDIRSGAQVTADGLTTINQVNGNDADKNGKIIVGLGITFYYEGLSGREKLNIVGDGLTQYNYVAEDEKDCFVSDAETYRSLIFSYVDKNFKYTNEQKTWINTGIVALNANEVGENNITKISGYSAQKISAVGKSAYIYTKQASAYSNCPPVTPPEFETSSNYPIEPIYSFEYPTTSGKKNYLEKTDNSTKYCYWDSSRSSIIIGLEDGDSFSFNTDIITINKNGNVIEPSSIKLNGTTCSDNINFTKSGEYTIAYTYTDPYNYELYGKQSQSVTYTKTINVITIVADKTLNPATFDFNGKGYKQVTGTNNITYVMPNIDDSSVDGLNYVKKTVGGETVYYPVVCVRNGSPSTKTTISGSALGKSSTNTALLMVFDGIVTITDNNNIYGSNNTNMADGKLSALESNLKSALVWASSNSYDTEPDVVSGKQCYKSASIQGVNRTQTAYDVEYIYADDAGNEYHYFVKYVFPAKGTGTNAYYQANATFKVTINCGSNGTVDKTIITGIKYGTSLTANLNKLMNGDTVIATATPNDKYAPSWSGLTDSVTKDTTVTLKFVKECTLTINCGQGGTVNTQTITGVSEGSKLTVNGNNLLCNGSVVATANPSSGGVANWIISNTTVSDDMTINLEFVTPITITITAGDNGSVNPTSIKVAPGKQLTYSGTNLSYDGVVIATAIANSGYDVGSWSGVPSTAITTDTNVSISFKEQSTECFTSDTLITMADGSKKRVDELLVGEEIVTFDHVTGKLSTSPVAYIFYSHLEYDVTKLHFANGTTITVLQAHCFYNQEENKYVEISHKNVENYIGKKFFNADTMSFVELIDYEYSKEYMDAYSVLSAYDINHVANGFLAVSDEIEGLFNYFDYNDNMQYDVEKMQEDIDTYGLVPYEMFAEYCTEEEFNVFNCKYLGIAVAKGLTTYDSLAERMVKFSGNSK